jgi:DUF1009 family protein
MGSGGGRIGLVAGNGRFPLLFAEAARKAGLEIVAAAHRGEVDPALEQAVHAFTWVQLGQVDRVLSHFRRHGVERAVMAGGIGRVKAFTQVRPDLGALRIIAGLRSFRDDALLRAVANHFERAGVAIVSPSEFVPELLAPEGHLAGPALSESQARDVTLGVEVATLLGRADVGQAVVVKGGHVLALEAVEGTDEAIRRGGRYGGAGAVVVKLCKPGQDERFDLPAVGTRTLDTMQEVGATVLAVEAGRTLLLDPGSVLAEATRRGLTVLGLAPRAG